MVLSQYTGHFPSEMAGYFKSRWNKAEIWALPLEIHSAAVNQFSWHLSYPFWSTSPPEPLFDLQPRNVLKNPDSYPPHWHRITTSDLSYPIDVEEFGEKLVILDGLHRLAHAVLKKHENIQFRCVPKAHIQSVL